MRNSEIHFNRLSRHPVFLLCSVSLLASLCYLADLASAGHAGSSAETVVMIVDYGDGVQKHFTAVPWRKSMTIEDVMKYASRHPRGLKLAVRGKGPTAFLYKVDDLENQGGRGRNWVFRVNDKLGDRSFAIFELKPDDTVLWKFGEYE